LGLGGIWRYWLQSITDDGADGRGSRPLLELHDDAGITLLGNFESNRDTAWVVPIDVKDERGGVQFWNTSAFSRGSLCCPAISSRLQARRRNAAVDKDTHPREHQPRAGNPAARFSHRNNLYRGSSNATRNFGTSKVSLITTGQAPRVSLGSCLLLTARK
jgi:hypothetical protein